MNCPKLIFHLIVLAIPSITSLSAQQLTLLAHWSDTTLPASTVHNNRYNDVWGMVVEDREIAVIGSTWGTHFIDVTNPHDIYEIARIQGAYSGTGVIHRDYHHYGCYLYAVCDEGESTLQIMKVGKDTVEVLYDSDELIKRSHNIFIDNGILYALAVRNGNDEFFPMGVYDLRNSPDSPELIGYYRTFGDMHVHHVHDAYVRNGIAFLNCGYNGMAIVDFSHPESPVTLSTLTSTEYPHSGYNHSGWLDTAGQYYFMLDETHGSPIKVVDVRDLTNPYVVNWFKTNDNSPYSIPHNAMIRGEYLYISYYYDGVQIFNIQNPELPKHHAFYPTSQLSPRKRYEGAWGVFSHLPSGILLASDMQNGLFVFDRVEDVSPVEFDFCDFTTTKTWSVTNSNKKSYKVIYRQGEIIIKGNSNSFLGLPLMISLYSSSGKMIYSDRRKLSAKNPIVIDYPLSSGLYYIHIIDVNGDSFGSAFYIGHP